MGSERRSVLIIDDLLARYRTLRDEIGRIGHRWDCRWENFTEVHQSLTYETLLFHKETGALPWEDVALVLTDTKSFLPERDPRVMPYSGIELALRILALPGDRIPVVGYTYDARSRENGAVRVAWAVTGCPLVDFDDLTEPLLTELLRLDKDPIFVVSDKLVQPTDDDWRNVGLCPPSEGTDPDGVGDALFMALTEEGRRQDRGALWDVIALRTIPDKTAQHAAREWAKEHIGPKLGPCPATSGRWSFPPLSEVLRRLSGFA